MNKFVFLSLALLGWVFWELSGGSDFKPKSQIQMAKEKTPQHAEDTQVVSRAALSVPIIQASATTVSAQTAATSELLPATSTAISAVEDQPLGVPVVVASLATGLEVFATPGVPALTPPTATDATIENTVALALEPQQTKDFRRVRGSRVNMRGGPGTSYSVLMVLPRDSQVEVLRDNGSGWVKLRDNDSGRIGWMAAKMLVAPTE